MKAAFLYGPKDIKVEEVEIPKPGKYGAVVRVRACGICDMFDLDDWFRAKPGRPIGIGHEWSGEVVEVGSEVTFCKVGDRFFGYTFEPCFRCEACLVGDYWRCINWKEAATALGFREPGAFAEYYRCHYILPENAILLPADMSFRDLALIEPLCLSVGVANKARNDELWVIIGQEILGLGIVALLKEKNIKVVACDISNRRLKASKDLGADIVVNMLEEDVMKVVQKETAGLGADVVVTTINRLQGILLAMACVKRAGRIWLADAYTSEATPFKVPQIPVQKLIRMAAGTYGYYEPPITPDPVYGTLQTVWGTLGPMKPRLEKALELIRERKITAEKHVTHVFPLEKISEAFEVAMTSDRIKVMIEP